MIADFYDTFDESPDKESEIPQEVLDILAEKLPSSFMYYRDDEGEYRAGPKPEHVDDSMILRVDIDEKFAEEQLKNIPKNKWAEYIYRMQLRVPIKRVRIGDKEKQIPLENTVGNPLSSSVEIQNIYMYPEAFPPIQKIDFETEESDKIVIGIARQPCESFDKILLTNVDFPAMQIRFILTDDYVDSKVTYTVTPTKAESVSDAVAAIHLFNGLRNGTVKIGGKKITKPVIGKADFDVEKLNDAIEFWTTAKKLEKELHVKFIPSAEFPIEDVELFSQLNYCILNNKRITWEHPFDHFHVSDINMKTGQVEDLLGKEGVECVFIEGPIHASLLGAEFELYSETKLSNMVITSVEWDDEKKKSGEIYVADPIGNKWKLYRKYMTEEQRDKMTLKDSKHNDKM